VVLARCRTSGFSLIGLLKAGKRRPVPVAFSAQDMHPRSGDLFYVTGEDLNRYVNQIFGSGAKIESLVSDTLMFSFPLENHRKVPVQPVYSMSFKPQHVNVAELKVKPDSVTVYGEPFHIDNIDRVFTEPLNLENLSSSVHGEARLDKIKGVRISDASVQYSMEVVRYVEIRASLPVGTRNVPKGRLLTVYPSRADVAFTCAFPVVSNPLETAVICVDYNDFASSLDGQCLPYAENLPQGVLGYSVTPEVFDCMESGR